MQDAVPVGTGAMAAILGLDARRWSKAAPRPSADSGEVVEAVNFNDPTQTVIAGSKAGVEKACEMLKAMGAKRALPLPVSAPFHSSLMKPAAEQLREALAMPRLPRRRIARGQQHRCRGRSRPGERSATRCTARPSAPVRWVECVQALRARGLTHLIECGPGKVLAGMVKRIDAELPVDALYRPGHPGRGQGAAGMSRASRGRSPWSPAPRAASAARLRWQLAAQGVKVIGTATSEPAPRRSRRRWRLAGLPWRRASTSTTCGAVEALIDAIAKEHGGAARAGQQRRHHARHSWRCA